LLILRERLYPLKGIFQIIKYLLVTFVHDTARSEF
jgi:hypothetical protein